MRRALVCIALLVTSAVACSDDAPDVEVVEPPEVGTQTAIGSDGVNRVLVMEGTFIDAPSYTTPYLYEVDSKRWTRTPEPPFAHPLYEPSIAWTGAEFVVMGTTCDDPPDDFDAEPACAPGAFEAASYEPDVRKWQSMERSSPPNGGASIVRTSSEWSVVADDGSYWALDHESLDWRRLPVSNVEAFSSCIVGEQVLFLGERSLRAAAWSLAGSGEASGFSSPSIDADLLARPWSYACAGDGLLAIRPARRDDEPITYLYSSGEWREVAAAPAPRHLRKSLPWGPRGSIVIVPGGDSYITFDGARWSDPVPVGHEVSDIALVGDRLVVISGRAGGGTLEVFDL